MKNKLTFLIIFFLLFTALNNLKTDAQVKIPNIFINGVELKFRNAEDEKKYFKENKQQFTEFVGMPYIKDDTLMLPLKKTLNLAGITYTVSNNDITLQNKYYSLKTKINSYNAILKINDVSENIKLNNKILKSKDNLIYIPIDILSYMGYVIEYDNDTVYIYNSYITDITDNIKDEYKQVLNVINKERKENKNMPVKKFINNPMLPNILLLDTDSKNIKIVIPKGEYLENFYYGKMIFLLNKQIIGSSPFRQKEKDTLSYYIKKDNMYYLQEEIIYIADEIVIYCPYCKSNQLIKISNPFKKCDCER
ncbi:stalk domain-containing protein [Peptoanaerobacter stomatis]